jgi:hypothetical protein
MRDLSVQHFEILLILQKTILKMQKLYFILIASLLSAGFFSQTEKCGAVQNKQSGIENIPGFAAGISTAEQLAKNWLQEHKTLNAKTHSTVVIPVVFHCVYKDSSDVTFIADSTFNRQIAVMNETYSLSNANFSNTRPIFDSIAANTDIQFCLAGIDTSGNPTSGIMRYQSSSNWFFSITNNQIKTTYPPWDPSRYLNVWTCDMKVFGQNVVLGYATFPGTPPATDGIVLAAEFVGFQNNGTSNNLGRTMVHETGHWLGLRHIWGDGQSSSAVCDSTDYVDDTPYADAASNTNCDTTKNVCANENIYWTSVGVDPPDMVENYMDYSNDGCMTMFTKGQKDRMWSFLNTSRSGFLNNSVACNMVGWNEENFSEQVSVFPNPSGGFFSLRLSGNFNGSRLEIFNPAGQKIKEADLFTEQNTIDASGLANGIYFIKITNGSRACVKKLILQK